MNKSDRLLKGRSCCHNKRNPQSPDNLSHRQKVAIRLQGETQDNSQDVD